MNILDLNDDVLGRFISCLDDDEDRFKSFGVVCTKFHLLAYSAPYLRLFLPNKITDAYSKYNSLLLNTYNDDAERKSLSVEKLRNLLETSMPTARLNGRFVEALEIDISSNLPLFSLEVIRNKFPNLLEMIISRISGKMTRWTDVGGDLEGALAKFSRLASLEIGVCFTDDIQLPLSLKNLSITVPQTFKADRGAPSLYQKSLVATNLVSRIQVLTNLEAISLNFYAPLHNLEKLIKVSINFESLFDFENFCTVSLPNLKTLALEGNRVLDLPISNLSRFKSLETLSLSQISVVSYDPPEKFENLKKLMLEIPEVSDINSMRAFENAKNLTDLYLQADPGLDLDGYNRLNVQSLREIMPVFSNLTRLTMNSKDVSRQTYSEIVFQLSSTQLQFLHLTASKFPPEVIGHLGRLKGLQYLDLDLYFASPLLVAPFVRGIAPLPILQTLIFQFNFERADIDGIITYQSVLDSLINKEFLEYVHISGPIAEPLPSFDEEVRKILPRDCQASVVSTGF